MCAMFKEVHEQLIVSLWKQLAVDEDIEGVIDKEQCDDDTYEFRKRTCELISDTCFIVSPEDIIKLVWGKVKEDAGSWTKAEAGLKVIGCVCSKR